VNELNPNHKKTDPGDSPQIKSETAEMPASALSTPPSSLELGLRHLRAEAEIHAISRALERTGWNRRRAAELLSISYRGLLYKIRQYDITSASASQLSGLPENAKVE
jgi:DNA-binding NtrC family response regulator